jgi:hypothetical protein
LPLASATTHASAVATVRPRWITAPSQVMRPMSRVIGRAKLTFTSSDV